MKITASISASLLAPTLAIALAGCCSVENSHPTEITHASIELRGVQLSKDDMRKIQDAFHQYAPGGYAIVYRIQPFVNGAPTTDLLGKMSDLDVGPSLISDIACLAKSDTKAGFSAWTTRHGFSSWTTRIGLPRHLYGPSGRACTTSCVNRRSDLLVQAVAPILAKYNQP